ncbi:MAG: hypothetical protein ACM3N9_03180, partial [Syntrophothermus sp.]
MIKNTGAAFLLFLFLILFGGCSKKTPDTKDAPAGDFEVADFNPLQNWNYDSAGVVSNAENHLKSINLDYNGALDNGFIIPTIHQVKEGKFIFSFSLKNKRKQDRKFYYKIYYQNESYKFPERDPMDSTRQNLYAQENFYGSWEDVTVTFMETPVISGDNDYHQITGDFRIAGNPRDEKRYYSDKNDRWKRNPRVGRYSFLLVVTTDENLKAIPEYIKNISLMKDGNFVHPYFYFFTGEGKNLTSTVSLRAAVELAVVAKPDPAAGIYISDGYFNNKGTGAYFCKTCGVDPELKKNAPFEQFTHYIDASTKMANIPVIADVLKDNYSLTDYNWDRQFYTKEELVNVLATESREPCKTAIADAE